LKAGLPRFRVFPRICRLKKAALKENRKIGAVLSAREGKTVFFVVFLREILDKRKRFF